MIYLFYPSPISLSHSSFNISLPSFPRPPPLCHRQATTAFNYIMWFFFLFKYSHPQISPLPHRTLSPTSITILPLPIFIKYFYVVVIHSGLQYVGMSAFDNFVTIWGGVFLSYRPKKNISVSHGQIVFTGEGQSQWHHGMRWSRQWSGGKRIVVDGRGEEREEKSKKENKGKTIIWHFYFNIL